MIEIDATDARILTVLQKRGRMSNADLADEVNLSASACHRRVQRLETSGIIRDYVALLDPKKLGRPTVVFVEITLSGQADEVLEAFEREVARIPDVLECHLMAGTADYLLKVVAEDTEDFARIHRKSWRDCRGWRRCIRPLPCGLCGVRQLCRFEGRRDGWWF